MNIAIIGRHEALFETAFLLYEQGHTIRLIVTASEAPEYNRSVNDFEQLAQQLGAEFLSTPKIGEPKIVEFIRKCGQIKIGISMNYPNIIPQHIIDLFALGILNAHGGDLPRYRGNACQAWAILNGEDKIGLCIHKMVGGELDKGDIIERDYLSIDMNTKIGSILNWMTGRIPHMFSNAIKLLMDNSEYVLEIQSEALGGSLRCYPRKPEDGKIDWRLPAIDIFRLINASSEPFAGAYCNYNKKKVVIWEASLVFETERFNAIPGQVGNVNMEKGTVTVLCGEGKIDLIEVEVDGERGAAAEFVKNLRERLS